MMPLDRLGNNNVVVLQFSVLGGGCLQCWRVWLSVSTTIDRHRFQFAQLILGHHRSVAPYDPNLWTWLNIDNHEGLVEQRGKYDSELLLLLSQRAQVGILSPVCLTVIMLSSFCRLSYDCPILLQT